MKIYLSLLFFFFAGLLWADELRVLTTPEEGCFTISGATATDKCIILYDSNDGEVVQTVLECLFVKLSDRTRQVDGGETLATVEGIGFDVLESFV